MTYTVWISLEDYSTFNHRMEVCESTPSAEYLYLIHGTTYLPQNMQYWILKELGLFFPIQMIIDFHTQKCCMYVSSMNLFAHSIAIGAYNEFIGVTFTVLVF